MRRATLTGALAALTLAAAADAHAQGVVLSSGHVDYGVRIVDGQLRSQVKDETAGAAVWRAPESTVFSLGPAARETLPAGFEFIGPAGSTAWLIPQVQKATVLWAGWNTESLSAATVTGPATWRLTGVSGPGTVAVFQTGAGGGTDMLFNSADGLPDARQVPLGVHAHGNWSFSRPGTYQLTFQWSATLVDGGPQTHTATLPVVVTEPEPVPPPAGGGGGAGPTPPPDEPAPAPAPPPAPAPVPGPPAPAPTPPGTAPSTAVPKPALQLRRGAIRGRRLTLQLRLGSPGTVRAEIRRRGSVVTRTPPRRVSADARRIRLALPRALEPGSYRVRVRLRSSGEVLTRRLTVKVAPR